MLSHRQCLSVEGKVCGQFLPLKEHDLHRLCVTCRGKSCHLDNQRDECYEWYEDHCRMVADYAEKLSLQQERKRTSSSSLSSFSGFSLSMPVPLERLSSANSGVITTSASSRAVCAVAGPSVTTAPVISTPGLLVPDYPWKRRRVTDLKERELMLANFKDWWASRRSTPRPGLSSALQLPVITPPVVPVPIPSSMLAIPVAAASFMSSRSVVSSSRSAMRQQSRHSPIHRPAPAPPAVPNPFTGSSWTRSRSSPWTCYPSRGRVCHGTHHPAVPGPIPRPVARPEAINVHGTHQKAGPGPFPGPVTRPKAVITHGTRHPSVHGPVP